MTDVQVIRRKNIDIQIMECDTVEHYVVVWLFALYEGRVIGTLVLHKDLPRCTETPFIFDWYVVPECRGHRVGIELGSALRDYLEQHGYTECYAHRKSSDDGVDMARGKAWIERQYKAIVDFVRYDANIDSNIFRLRDNPDG